MKKILFLIKSLEGGGAEKVLITYLKGLDSNKYKITVKTVFDIGLYKEQLPTYIEYKTIIKKTNKTKMRIMQRFLTYLSDDLLRKIFMEKNLYDIEISFLEGNQCKLISSAPKNVKKLAWIHIDISNIVHSGFKNFNDEYNCYKKFDNIICVSDDVKNNFKKKFNQEIEAMTIYNPIDKKRILKYRNVNNSNNDRFIICSMGRLVQQKRFDRLIEAVSILVNKGYKIETLILGDGILKEELQEMINNKNLNKHVRLLGFQKNPYSTLSNCDIFVCSSDNEGFSLVIAEALVMGKPIISTKCSGPSELLGYGKYGKLVGKSAEDIASAVIQIIENNEFNKYRELSDIRSEFFNIENSVKELEMILEGE